MKHTKPTAGAQGQNGTQNFFKSSLIGGGIGLALAALVILISPFAMLSFGSPNSLALPFAAIAVFLGSAAGSVFAATQYKDSPIAAGLLASGIIALPLTIISFFIPYEASVINIAVISASLIGASLLGSLSVAKLSSNRKRNMKKALKRR